MLFPTEYVTLFLVPISPQTNSLPKMVSIIPRQPTGKGYSCFGRTPAIA